MLKAMADGLSKMFASVAIMYVALCTIYVTAAWLNNAGQKEACENRPGNVYECELHREWKPKRSE